MIAWVDLAPRWDEIRAYAEQRDKQKRGYRSSRYWNKESHFLGLLGELVYGISIGMEPDFTLRRGGDGGSDFPDTDVKATKYWTDPWLKVPVDSTMVGTYALVGIDVEQRRGYVAGVFSRKEVRAALIKDWGYGPMFSLDAAPLFHQPRQCPSCHDWHPVLTTCAGGFAPWTG